MNSSKPVSLLSLSPLVQPAEQGFRNWGEQYGGIHHGLEEKPNSRMPGYNNESWQERAFGAGSDRPDLYCGIQSLEKPNNRVPKCNEPWQEMAFGAGSDRPDLYCGIQSYHDEPHFHNGNPAPPWVQGDGPDNFNDPWVQGDGPDNFNGTWVKGDGPDNFNDIPPQQVSRGITKKDLTNVSMAENPNTHLVDICQKRKWPCSWIDQGNGGPLHQPIFQFVVCIDGRYFPPGRGGNKKAAKKEASRVALDILLMELKEKPGPSSSFSSPQMNPVPAPAPKTIKITNWIQQKEADKMKIEEEEEANMNYWEKLDRIECAGTSAAEKSAEEIERMERWKRLKTEDRKRRTPKLFQERKIAPDNIGFKMLAKMGWASGQPLGKFAVGIVEPVRITMNDGRLGLRSGEEASTHIRDKSGTGGGGKTAGGNHKRKSRDRRKKKNQKMMAISTTLVPTGQAPTPLVTTSQAPTPLFPGRSWLAM